MRSLLDLILPLECAGCGVPGEHWCQVCSLALFVPPIAVRPRVDPGVPCWSLGTYSGPRRSGVIALKERGRRSVALPFGRALAEAVGHLRDAGEIDPPELSSLILICAPSRARAARARGGDPVLRCARIAAEQLAPERVLVPELLRMTGGVRDSVGLSAGQRQHNVAGRIEAVGVASPRADTRVMGSADFTVLLIDDVVTTGATLAESARVLTDFGVPVAGALVVASA
ncbi:phosphoribosyltransferase [Rhodococcus sp. 06-462-5]|uniref:ComF family protein n=1 Tax=unclassified Rhodococcus (in: high G+C Gram-positive bacteria) TaxID=192944 RepID=UPI000B9B2CE2|nr:MULTISPECIES: ComF family protein [unclassified Rhodococcus (in: high G+C Gram-positive bacteria)]OZC70323.1 phosphoribosyltransferase [Rhodococcus sp. 06-462-5]OZE69314.1 phosphoribosyltransferase [Rhodococcus sp. 02-925g]